MRRTLALLPLVVLAACSSAPTPEELEEAKRLRAVANDLVRDQDTLEDVLVKSEARCAARRRDALDAWVAKHDEATLERLALVVATAQSVEDARSAIRSGRHAAVEVGELGARLEDTSTSDEDRHELAERLALVELDLRTARRELELARDRYRKHDDALKKALDAEKGAAPR
jgi:hypothetical protein